MRAAMTTPLLQLALHLDGDLDATQVLASSVHGPVPIWLDQVDVERLDSRKLSLGSHGYAQLWHDGQSTPVHRWVMGAERGDGKIVDHISGDRYDCRRSNLRFVTPSESSANRRCTAASGYRGVYRVYDRWTASGKVGGRSFHLGTFDTPQEAAEIAHEWRAVNLPGYTGRDRTNQAAHRRAVA